MKLVIGGKLGKWTGIDGLRRIEKERMVIWNWRVSKRFVRGFRCDREFYKDSVEIKNRFIWNMQIRYWKKVFFLINNIKYYIYWWIYFFKIGKF